MGVNSFSYHVSNNIAKSPGIWTATAVYLFLDIVAIKQETNAKQSALRATPSAHQHWMTFTIHDFKDRNMYFVLMN